MGHAVIQLAAWAGAVVITTISSTAEGALVRAAGAHHVINHKELNPAGLIRSIVMSRHGPTGLCWTRILFLPSGVVR